MNNNALVIGYWALEWAKKLPGKHLLSCFTIGKTQIYFVFEHGLCVKLELQHGQFFYQKLSEPEVPDGSRFYLFESIHRRIVEQIIPHFGERSFHIRMDNDRSLLFKLHGPHTNVILFDKEHPVAWWRFGMVHDRKNELGKYRKNALSPEELKQALIRPGDSLPFLKGELKERWLTAMEAGRLDTFVEALFNPSFFVGKQGHKPYFSLWSQLKNAGEETLMGKKRSGKNEKDQHTEVPDDRTFSEKKFNSVTEALGAYSGRYLGYKKWKDTQQVLLSELDKRIMKKGNLILKHHEQAKKLSNNDFQEQGDLLMAYAFEVKPDAERVEFTSFNTGNPIEIKLKSGISPQKNAERYYKKAKNARQRLEELENETQRAKEEFNTLKHRRELVKTAKSYKDLVKLRKAIPAEKTIGPFYKVEELGYQFWIGKHAQSNDVILQKAHKDDWWFHARDVRGSHVLVKNRGEEKLPEKVLELAAGFAAYYSKAKTEQLAPVQYTRRKFVRKKKSLHAGQVILEREKVILAVPMGMSSFT